MAEAGAWFLEMVSERLPTAAIQVWGALLALLVGFRARLGRNSFR